MTSELKRIAADRLAPYLAKFPPEFIIAEGDLVTVAAHENRGTSAGDFFGFHTFRVVDGDITDEWSNDAIGSQPLGSGAADAARARADVGEGTPEFNKRVVADFYRCVFDAHNADAVQDFVTTDYRQHSRHMPEGRDGLESFVRMIFPDGPIETPDSASIPPEILMGEGDIVVIAAGIPQASPQGMQVRYIYDAYRLRDGLLCEHWSGVDPENPTGL